MGCHFLLQGIFPTQELNPGLLHCRQILYQLSYDESLLHITVSHYCSPKMKSIGFRFSTTDWNIYFQCDILSCAQLLSHVRLFATHGLYLARLLCPWNFPGKNTGVGCNFLLLGIFLTQGLNPFSCISGISRQISLSLHHLGRLAFFLSHC